MAKRAAVSETTLVCTGDSFTEGLSDELRPDGRPAGWADRVAAALAAAPGHGPVRYSNLAVRGKLLDQVTAEQVEPALAMTPTILTFHAGPNDVLRPGVELGELSTRYRTAVTALRERYDGTLVLFTSRGRIGRGGRTEVHVRDRFRAFNEGVRETAECTAATLVDLEPVQALGDPRLWNPDRLHFNRYGHVRVAAAVLEALGVDDAATLGGPVGWWREPIPAGMARLDAELRLDDLRWAGAHLLPWAMRRLRGVSSGDGLLPKEPVLVTVQASMSRTIGATLAP